MPFLKLSDLELRDIAKRHIESLEFWLRRIIHVEFILIAGEKYWEIEPSIINKSIREKVAVRIEKSEKGRFSRWIDATLIEDLISFLFKEDLYKRSFKKYFEFLFPIAFSSGREYIKLILEKMAVVRNALYHSNPVSVRQVEQTVCYVNDIIDAIKAYYVKANFNMDFNAPSFLSWSDSLGNKVYRIDVKYDTMSYNQFNHKFRVGERIKMYVEADTSFNSDSYIINWRRSIHEIIGNGNELNIIFDETWIGQLSNIRVEIISNKTWHRREVVDDIIIIFFSVLPPIEY